MRGHRRPYRPISCTRRSQEKTHPKIWSYFLVPRLLRIQSRVRCTPSFDVQYLGNKCVFCTRRYGISTESAFPEGSGLRRPSPGSASVCKRARPADWGKTLYTQGASSAGKYVSWSISKAHVFVLGFAFIFISKLFQRKPPRNALSPTKNCHGTVADRDVDFEISCSVGLFIERYKC